MSTDDVRLGARSLCGVCTQLCTLSTAPSPYHNPPRVSVAIDKRQPVRLDCVVSSGVHRLDVRNGRHGKVLAGRVRLLADLGRVLQVQPGVSGVGLRDSRDSLARDDAGAVKRGRHEVAPLRADLEEPQPPRLAEVVREELLVVVCAKAVLDARRRGALRDDVVFDVLAVVDHLGGAPISAEAGIAQLTCGRDRSSCPLRPR